LSLHSPKIKKYFPAPQRLKKNITKRLKKIWTIKKKYILLHPLRETETSFTKQKSSKKDNKIFAE
jgi:hypothetical protein